MQSQNVTFRNHPTKNILHKLGKCIDRYIGIWYHTEKEMVSYFDFNFCVLFIRINQEVGYEQNQRGI